MIDSVAIAIRPAAPTDIEQCSRICFEAFKGISERGGYPLDFPSPAYARTVIEGLIANPRVFGIVAEDGSRVVGSNFLDERDAIRGVGPISVDPRFQGGGVGRLLMKTVIERGRDADGVRLLQDSFNAISLSLYTSLGFAVKEPIALLAGMPSSGDGDGTAEVRPMRGGDLERCVELCRRVHGLDRRNALAEALDHFTPFVALRHGELVAYCSSLTVWPVAHAVAEREEDMRALILGAADLETAPVSFLVPIRAALFAWCIRAGMRVQKPMNLMAIGSYQEPRGSWFPSVMY
jgi:predicted N-acetyltransferase YhbS